MEKNKGDEIKKKEIEITFYTRWLQVLVIIILTVGAGAANFIISGTTDDQMYNIIGSIAVATVVGFFVFAIFTYRKVKQLIRELKEL